MTPTRPYLIRAFYDWILDNGLTPYLLVDAGVEGTRVPTAYVKEGRIVLNVSPAAVSGITLGVEEIAFSARFAGVAQEISLPTSSVMAIYARENGEGMFFASEESESPMATPGETGGSNGTMAPRAGGRPALRVVK